MEKVDNLEYTLREISSAKGYLHATDEVLQWFVPVKPRWRIASGRLYRRCHKNRAHNKVVRQPGAAAESSARVSVAEARLRFVPFKGCKLGHPISASDACRQHAAVNHCSS